MQDSRSSHKTIFLAAIFFINNNTVLNHRQILISRCLLYSVNELLIIGQVIMNMPETSGKTDQHWKRRYKEPMEILKLKKKAITKVKNSPDGYSRMQMI